MVGMLGTVGGVSDPVSFGLYLAGLVIAGAVLWWFSKFEGSPAEIPDGLDDYDAALLAFGGDEHRAAALAMLRLHEEGIIDPGEAAVRKRAEAQGLSPRTLYSRLHHEVDPLGFTPPFRRLQALPSDADPVERAVFEAAGHFPTAGSIRVAASRSPVLAEKRQRLHDMGLLLHSHRNGARRWRWFLWTLYLAVGAVVVISGGGDQSRGWLWAAMWVHLTVALWLTIAVNIHLSLETGTRAGRRVRHALWRPEEQVETAGSRPSRRRLALSGFDTVWEHDPVLALALHLPDWPESRGD